MFDPLGTIRASKSSPLAHTEEAKQLSPPSTLLTFGASYRKSLRVEFHLKNVLPGRIAAPESQRAYERVSLLVTH